MKLKDGMLLYHGSYTSVENIDLNLIWNKLLKKIYQFYEENGYIDDYYIEKISALEHKANVIENGGTETAIDIRIREKENFIITLFKKIKALILGPNHETNKQTNNM